MKIRTTVLALLCSTLTATLSATELPQTTTAKAGLSETKLAAVNQFMERQVADQKIAGGIVIISHQGKIGFFRRMA